MSRPYLPFARPVIDAAMIAAVGETLASRWIASGPQVAAFEKALSDHCGGRPVRAFTSATGAMEVALQLVGAGPGDEVLVPAQTFFAAANVVERVGARTVFVDDRADNCESARARGWHAVRHRDVASTADALASLGIVGAA